MIYESEWLILWVLDPSGGSFQAIQKSHEIGIPGKLERRSAGLKDTPWCFGELNDVFLGNFKKLQVQLLIQKKHFAVLEPTIHSRFTLPFDCILLYLVEVSFNLLGGLLLPCSKK